MHDVAKHPVYPGFHSLPMLEVSMNKAKWDSLPADIKSILTISVRDFATDMTSRLEMKDLEAVAEARKDPTVTVHDWPAEERAKFRAIAKDQWVKVAERSPNAKKVYDALLKYLTSQGLL